VVDIVAGFHHVTAEDVGLNDMSAEFAQESGNSGFAAA
jgi:hypothetical protein